MKLFSKQQTAKHIVYKICGIKFKKNIKKLFLEQRVLNLEQRVLNIEADIVLNSGLWDANYYIRTYHPEMTKYEALMYYLVKGYKDKENPSRLVDASKYKGVFGEPILDYLQRGQYQLTRLFYENKYLPTGEVPQTADKNSKKIIYTCITDDYDDIENIKFYHFTDSSYHYVCFTDNQDWIKRKQIGIWEIRPLEYTKLDNVRNNRWHKMHPHILFPQAEVSIYIDANIQIITDKFFNMVNTTSKDILLPVHSERIDLYKELKWAKSMKFDTSDVIDKQYELIKSSGFPENYGMFENNIIYRRHNDTKIIEMMNEWWYLVANYCQRDQASLAYIFWKYKRKIEDYSFENTRMDYRNFCVFPHSKEYKLLKDM